MELELKHLNQALKAHVVEMLNRCDESLKMLDVASGASRTDAERFYHMGEKHRVEMERISWQHTSAIFQLEIPTEDEETTN
jgi:hypothetical protein